MKTLKDKSFKIEELYAYSKKYNRVVMLEDVKRTLQDFYDDYWKESHIGDKSKQYIDCDKIDYILDKHFGNIIHIKTLQFLPNQDTIINGELSKK